MPRQFGRNVENLALGLLNAVLSDVEDTGGGGRVDVYGRKGLRDGAKGHGTGLAARPLLRQLNAMKDFLDAIVD